MAQGVGLNLRIVVEDPETVVAVVQRQTQSGIVATCVAAVGPDLDEGHGAERPILRTWSARGTDTEAHRATIFEFPPCLELRKGVVR